MAFEQVRLAIAIPQRNVVSESFIETHIEGLFSEPLVVWGSPRPIFVGDRESVLAGVSKAAASILGWIGRMNTERAHGAIGRRLPDLVYSRLLARFLTRAEVEVVLAEYGPTAVRVLDACVAARTPLVVHFHGYDAYQQKTLIEFQDLYQRLFRTAYRVVAVSNHMIEQLMNLGCPVDRLICNPCGVDVNRFAGAQPEKATPLLLSLGRFVEKKGPLQTLQAFALAKEKDPQSRLVMLGDGPLREACIELAGQLEIQDSVSFPGSVDHDEVVAWMRRARCFVQHSRRSEDGDSEGTPVAVLEASSCGLPVVSTRHAGIVEAVRDGVSGFLVAEGDVAGMADRMLRFVRDPKLAGTMGLAARSHIRNCYSTQQRLGRLRGVLAEAVGQG
jgi:glycosyltransferase involved in cell wall biosynthesis